MNASYEGSEIFNKFPTKIAQFLDYFCTNCRLKTLFFLAKSVVPLLLILTHQFPFFFVSPLYTGSPSQKFNSPWVEPFTLLRNAALSVSFGMIRIRYKQKTR